MSLALPQLADRARPFSCGSQHADWSASNCHRCTKDYDRTGAGEYRCDLQRAIDEAAFGDGTMPADVAARMGYADPLAYSWPCGEVEWTPEWIAESRRRRTIRYRLRKWWHARVRAVRMWFDERRVDRRMRYANRFADDRRTCWPEWVSWAMFDGERPEPGECRSCKADADRDGSCYCGKFTRDSV